jgi:hypothetical protein
MKSTHEIHAELLRFAEIKLKVPAERLADDPSFEEMSVDSLTKLEILLHGDDTFGSHVLDYLEDGLLTEPPPTRLSELALLIPKCMRPAKEVFNERKAQSVTSIGELTGSGVRE